MLLTWLGHSSFEMKLASGEVFLFDPWLDNPSAPKGYQPTRLDGILVSHGHFDHVASVEALAKEFGCPVVANFEICEWFAGKGVKDTVGMNKGGTATVGPLDITLTHAMHSSTFTENGVVIPLGEPCGIVVKLPDERSLYFAGDTDVFGDMRLIAEIYQPEIALLPIGDRFTMGPRQAAVAARLLSAKTIIPMHYGTFPQLTGTPEALRALWVDLVTSQPGETIEV